MCIRDSHLAIDAVDEFMAYVMKWEPTLKEKQAVQEVLRDMDSIILLNSIKYEFSTHKLE